MSLKQGTAVTGDDSDFSSNRSDTNFLFHLQVLIG